MFMLWIGIDFVACVAISPKSELFSCRNFMAVCLSAWIASHSVRVGEVDMRFCLPIRYSDALDLVDEACVIGETVDYLVMLYNERVCLLLVRFGVAAKNVVRLI